MVKWHVVIRAALATTAAMLAACDEAPVSPAGRATRPVAAVAAGGLEHAPPEEGLLRELPALFRASVGLPTTRTDG